MKVSVIMPCYNDGRYLQEAIGSVLSQTYSDIELVLIDDGSDDEITAQVMDQAKHPCILKLKTAHIGPSAARNAGIAAAAGQYILPLDADDLIDPTYIEKAAAVLDQQPETCIVYCQADFFGAREGAWELPPYSITEMLIGNIIFATAMFRKQAYVDVGGYKTNMVSGLEDYDFWLSLIEAGAQVHQIPEVLFHYRIKKASRTVSLQSDAERVTDMYRLIYENHRALYQRNMDAFIIALKRKYVEQSHIISEQQSQLEVLKQRWGWGWFMLKRIKNALAKLAAKKERGE